MIEIRLLDRRQILTGFRLNTEGNRHLFFGERIGFGKDHVRTRKLKQETHGDGFESGRRIAEAVIEAKAACQIACATCGPSMSECAPLMPSICLMN